MGIIYKSLKLRLYPNRLQEEKILQNLGASRFLYNKMLEERISVYKQWKETNPNDVLALYKYKFKKVSDYKKEYPWLKNIDSLNLANTVIHLSSAYQNFFKSLSGKRKNKVGFPKFKKKKNKSSYTTSNVNDNIRINFENCKIKLPKIGWVKFRDERKNFTGIIKSATISKTSTGKYFVSVLFEQDLELSGNEITDSLIAKTIGLDMSLSKFFVDSNGNSPAYEALYRKYEKKIKKLHKILSKKQFQSKNYQEALHRLCVIYEKIANKRKDFTHKLSTQIVKDYDVIVVEHLSLQAMSKALRLGKSVMDLGYSEFIRQLQYKSLWNNKIFIQADRWFASSKICSICGYKHDKLELADRYWNCPNCGNVIDRDKNAGINLKKYGLQFLGIISENNGVANLISNRVGTTRIDACGDRYGGGIPDNLVVYESSVDETGSTRFYNRV